MRDQWYQHEPGSVIENDRCKILWDFTVQTDHIIQARRPDMIATDKETNKAQVIDFASSYDSRVDSEEMEQIEKYQDLVRELKKLWDMKEVVIPIVLGALGTTPKTLQKRMNKIGIETRIGELQNGRKFRKPIHVKIRVKVIRRLRSAVWQEKKVYCLFVVCLLVCQMN